MRRWTTAFLIVLALAAAVSLLSAWGFALWSPQTASGLEGLLLDDPIVRPHFQYGTFHRAMTNARQGRGWRVDIVMAFTDTYVGGPHNSTRRTLYRAGWPMYSFYGEEWVVRGEDGPSRGMLESPGVLRPSDAAMRKLVWRPIWRGFLLNTAVIATLPVTLVLFFPLRRAVRRRRGCCAVCGYSLRGLDKSRASGRCPECGAS